jgi:hypothetical protein
MRELLLYAVRYERAMSDAAAQILAQEPRSWNTVNDRLHKNARRPDSPIERVSHGH